MATNPDRTPVAQDLFTYCTKEKIDTWHVVRNHNAKGIVERVVCKACGSEHNYRKAPTAKDSSTAASRQISRSAASRGPTAREIAAATSSAALQDTWIKGLKKWGDKPVVTFDPSQSYSTGEVFDHEIFGKGVVQGRRENRVDVLFHSGLKTLPSRQPANN